MTDASLPPLSSLRPFEAAARLGSLSAAARALGVTQPAISRHIDGLEAALGARLFVRTPRGLRLTPAGTVLRDAVAAAFDALGEAAAQVRRAASGTAIVIACHTGFAQLWLAPRLPALRALVPEGFFRLAPTDREEEFAAGDIDLAIRFGTGDWPGWDTEKLLPERIVPVCSPDYRAGRPGLRRADLDAAALAGEALLHMDEVSRRWLTWPSWFAAQGVAVRLGRPRLLYASYPLLVQAALAGEGVALGWLGLVDEALAAGTLVPLLPPFEREGHGYFLCRRNAGRAATPMARLLERVRTWFLNEADAASGLAL